MISFEPTEDEAAFMKVAEGFADDWIRPMARNVEDNRIVDDSMSGEALDLGFLALELPEDWEGLELPLVSQVHILKALSYGDLGIVQGLPGAGDAATVMRLLKESDVLSAYKMKVMKGRQPTIAFLDVTDTEEPWSDSLSIRPDGGGYQLHGESPPVRLADSADYIVVAATVEGEQVLLWLDNDTPWDVIQGDYRLGLLAAGIARFSFNHADVAASHVLAAGENARELKQQIRTRLHILQAAKEVGLMEAALDYATEYTAERKAFGQEIAKFQGVSFRIAHMALETRIANHLVLEAATRADKSDPSAHGSAMSALHRSHQAVRYVTDSAVQLLGGHGFVQDFPVEKWMRDAQAHVSLYGRERDLLTQRGEQIMEARKEVVP